MYIYLSGIIGKYTLDNDLVFKMNTIFDLLTDVSVYYIKPSNKYFVILICCQKKCGN